MSKRITELDDIRWHNNVHVRLAYCFIISALDCAKNGDLYSMVIDVGLANANINKAREQGVDFTLKNIS